MAKTSSKIENIFARYSESGLFTHCYSARGSIDDEIPYFEYEHLPDGRSVFDLASLTKALVTTPLVFQVLGDKKWPMSSVVGDWLSGLNHSLDSRFLSVKIADLLAHKSGLPAWRNFWICKLGSVTGESLKLTSNRHQLMTEVLNRNVKDIGVVGKDVYSDVGFILLGYLIEVLGGQDQASVFREFAQNKLSSGDIELYYERDIPEPNKVVPTSWCALRGKELIGEVHDENCAALGGIAGHAGIFGSGRAIAKYLHRLLASQVGQSLLAENLKQRVLPVSQTPNGSLLGWRQGADQSALPFGQGAAIGHMGFTGVAFWLWPEKREYVMLLTNRVRSGRQSPGIAAMRREIFAELAAL